MNPPENNKDETIDEGTEAFMQWLGSSDKKSLKSGNPMVLRNFVNDVYALLYDTKLSEEVEVRLTDGIPYCNYCKSDECIHVGFTIWVEQLARNRHEGEEETIDDIID